VLKLNAIDHDIYLLQQKKTDLLFESDGKSDEENKQLYLESPPLESRNGLNELTTSAGNHNHSLFDERDQNRDDPRSFK
jgi:hypothetical protein